jgi:ribosomal protein S27AE
MDKDKQSNLGWECPRCGSVNAPQKDKCQCVKTEDTTKDTKQLLVE